MRIPFSLFDFFGYALPGFILIVIVTILVLPPPESVDPLFGNNRRNPTNGESTKYLDKVTKYLPTNVTKGFFFILVCYIVGFVTHGCCDFFFKFMSGEYIRMSDKFGVMKKYYEHMCRSNKLRCMKKYYTDNGWFEKGLFDCLNRDDKDFSEHFNPYSKQFVRKLRIQVREIFKLKVDDMEEPVEYTEIFHLCRNVVIKQSPDIYSRASTLQSRHESAKLMMFIFFLAALGFLLKGLFLILNGGLLLLYFAVTSFVLGIVFLYMYNRLLRYYRNYILYGFYQYAMDLERSEPMVRMD